MLVHRPLLPASERDERLRSFQEDGYDPLSLFPLRSSPCKKGNRVWM